MFVNPALAQEVAATAEQMPAGDPARILFQFFVIFVVFYFFLIRPQQKRLREHQAMQAAVSKGDVIVTTGGIVGKVIRSNAEDLIVEIADGVRVTVVRDRIAAKRLEAPKSNVAADVANETGDADVGTDKKGSEGLKELLTKK